MINIGSELGRGSVSFYVGVTLRAGMTLQALLLELAELVSKHPSREIDVAAIDKEHIIFVVRRARS